MSDTTGLPEGAEDALATMVKDTKRGFDLRARLKGRGVRKGKITLFLDEEVGVELGWAHDVYDIAGNVLRRDREGVVGELDELTESRNRLMEAYDDALKVAKELGKDAADVVPKPDMKATDERIAELTDEKVRLTKQLTKTAIVVSMQAVPPVIRKDMRRKAKETLGIKSKNIPEEIEDEFNLAHTAHLMTVMFKSIVDNESGATNTETTYEDAIDLIGYLPPGQYSRLDNEMGKVQFTDAISRDIEAQEDFS